MEPYILNVEIFGEKCQVPIKEHTIFEIFKYAQKYFYLEDIRNYIQEENLSSTPIEDYINKNIESILERYSDYRDEMSCSEALEELMSPIISNLS